MNDKQIGRPIARDPATFRSTSRKINSSMGVNDQVSRMQPSAGIKAGFSETLWKALGFGTGEAYLPPPYVIWSKSLTYLSLIFLFIK